MTAKRMPAARLRLMERPRKATARLQTATARLQKVTHPAWAMAHRQPRQVMARPRAMCQMVLALHRLELPPSLQTHPRTMPGSVRVQVRVPVPVQGRPMLVSRMPLQRPLVTAQTHLPLMAPTARLPVLQRVRLLLVRQQLQRRKAVRQRRRREWVVVASIGAHSVRLALGINQPSGVFRVRLDHAVFTVPTDTTRISIASFPVRGATRGTAVSHPSVFGSAPTTFCSVHLFPPLQHAWYMP